MPSTQISDELLTDGKINVIDLLCACKLTTSKGEARRLIQQGGVSVNGEKVTDFALSFDKGALAEGVKIKKGKKIFHKATI